METVHYIFQLRNTIISLDNILQVYSYLQGRLLIIFRIRIFNLINYKFKFIISTVAPSDTIFIHTYTFTKN